MAYSVFPVGNYKFGTKPARVDKGSDAAQRLERMRQKYEAEGVRRAVEAIVLVGDHGHPHVLLLQIGQSRYFKLPGGKLRPDEDELAGLRRKLDAYLSPEADVLRSPWDVGECVGCWWRPNFDSVLYPYVLPHVTRPKEVRRQYVVQLPERAYFGVPQNLGLVAVPLFELYDHAARYGPAAAALPAALSRLRLTVVAPEARAPGAGGGGSGGGGDDDDDDGGQGIPVGGGGGAGAAAGGGDSSMEEYEGIDRRASAAAPQ